MNRYPRRIIVTSITVFNCINYVNTVHQPILRGTALFIAQRPLEPIGYVQYIP